MVYPVQYPSAGYDTIPLSSQNAFTNINNIPVTQGQLTPDTSFYQQGLNQNYQSSGAFSQTDTYIPTADNVLGITSPNLSHATHQQQHHTVHNNHHNVQHNVHNPHELFPMEVNPAIQPRGLPEDGVLFSPSAERSSLFSETGSVAATPDISFPDASSGLREKRRDASRSASGFSETGAIVPVPDAVHFSVRSQESRQGRVVKTSAELFHPAAAQSASFSETAPVVPEPDQVSSFSGGGIQENRQGRVISSSELFRPVVAKTSSFFETIPVVPEADVQIISSNGRHKENRQGRVISSSKLFRPVAAKTSSFSETIPVVPEADVQIIIDNGHHQENRQGRVISSSKLFRPVAAKISSFSETIPVVPEADVHIINGNGRQGLRQGKVLQPDTSMFSSFSSTSEFFTETEPVVASPDAERNRDALFQASEKIQESRGGRVLGSSSISETAAVVPEPDEPVGSEKLYSDQQREDPGRPILFQPRPKQDKRQGRHLQQEKSSIISQEPELFTVVSQKSATEPKKFTFGLN